MAEKNNVVLIGMPGSGKSTLGIVLAKIMTKDFIDADIVIQNQCDKTLQKIIDACGPEGFIEVENEILSKIDAENSVIATGGSAVYSDEAMKHLAEIGTVVYLKISYDQLVHRLSDLQERGVVLKGGIGMSLKELYDERVGGAVKRRLRGMSAQVKRLEALSPTLRSFAASHGIDDGDTDALNLALSRALGCSAATGTGGGNDTCADMLPSQQDGCSEKHAEGITGIGGTSHGITTADKAQSEHGTANDNDRYSDSDNGTSADGTDERSGIASGNLSDESSGRDSEERTDPDSRTDSTGEALDTAALRRAHGWAAEAHEVARLYPDFDLRSEIADPRFRSLLRGGAGVRDAYEVVHRDELLPAAMRSAALSAVNKLTDSIAAGTVRPAENGVSAALPYACGVGDMTRAERDELARRVAHGERIVL